MTMLQTGDTAPWFVAPVVDGNPDYNFSTVGGRFVLLLFHGSTRWEPSGEALALVARHRALFDDANACLFGICVDPADWTEGRVKPDIPGIRWFQDPEGAISRAYGVVRDADGRKCYEAQWILLDRRMRVLMRVPLMEGEAVFAELARQLAAPPEDMFAPVLVIPRILEPSLCRALIAEYDAHGGSPSGFMREEGGVTLGKRDESFKRRSDHHIKHPDLLAAVKQRVERRLVPQVARGFQFDATRVERWMVACYDGDGGGFFRAHRDNTTKGTAHRRFACTINLNAEEYEGGDLRFPEFGQRTYRAPTGGAVIFSCSLMHEAMPVTQGRRYAFLPFLYDEAGARLRERNQAHLSPELRGYNAGTADPVVQAAE